MIKSARHIPALKQHIIKRATPGEKVLGKLFPSRGAGFPGGWDSDHIKQVNHFVDWTYVAIHTIAMKIASISPNIAWVTDANRPGPRTKRADQRGLLNAMGKGFGMPGTYGANGSGLLLPTSHTGKLFGDSRTHMAKPTELVKGRWSGAEDVSGSWHDYTEKISSDSMWGSNSAFLTMGEYRSKALSVVKPHEELEPVESGHLLRKLVEDPNPVDTHFDYRYELIMFKLLCGAAYEWVIPNAFGRPCERWVIPSHWVWPRTGGGQVVDADHPDADRLIQYYEVRPWGGMGSAGMLKLPPDQVIMHKFKSPVNKLLGYSKLWALSRWIDVEESISNSRFAQMSNQARPEFWVEMPASFNDPDDSMIARWEAKIAQKHQGEFNLHRPLFMPAGAKAQVLSFSPEEMCYLGSEEQIRDMILSGFGVPKSAVGVVSDMTFGSVLATLMSFCEQCINPLLTQEGEVSTKFLASRFDEEAPAWSQGAGGAHGGSGGWRRCRLWYDNCTPADPAQVNADIDVDLRGHAMTPNMLLALRGRPPYKLGGDNPILQGPGGMMEFPINVEVKGDDVTDLIRRYSESMAADKDVTKLGSAASASDLPINERMGEPKEPSDGQGQGDRAGDAGGGDPTGAAGDAVAEIADGPKVEKPNGKPAKSWRTKGVPDAVQAESGPQRKSLDSTINELRSLRQKADSRWTAQYTANDFADIESRLNAILPTLSKVDAVQAAKALDITLTSSTKEHALTAIRRWVLEMMIAKISQARSLRGAVSKSTNPTFYDECKDLARQVLKDMEIDR